MVGVEESASVVTCSCEDGGSKTGVSGRRLGGKVGGMRRGRKAQGRGRVVRVSEQLV
jgi:hypothetical protein